MSAVKRPGRCKDEECGLTWQKRSALCVTNLTEGDCLPSPGFSRAGGGVAAGIC